LGQLSAKLIYSPCGKYAFIRNFIKHQKNLPLNEKNNAHSGIIKRLNENLQLFNFQTINYYFLSPCLGAKEGLISPYGNGNGNYNNISKDLNPPLPPLESEEGGFIEKSWRDDFEMYLTDLRKDYKKIVIDTAYITERAKYHPGLNIKLSLEKACKDFWATEAGWKHKKKSKTNDLNWRSTLTKSLDQKCNQVWLQKGEINETNTEKTVAYID